MIRVLMPTDGTDLHVLIFPAEDLPGIWVAHVLEADLVTQGDSPGEALDMASDAWEATPPEARNRPAPREDWARWRGDPAEAAINVCDACGESDVTCVRRATCEKSR